MRIGVVGKYIEVKDSYKSLYEALAHGGIAHEAAVEVVWVDAERLEREGVPGHVAGLDGILVPGGFGDRGIEGKIQAIRYAREQKVPFFGICLGHAVRGDRVRPPRLRPRRRQLHRVRPRAPRTT